MPMGKYWEIIHSTVSKINFIIIKVAHEAVLDSTSINNFILPNIRSC